MKFSPHAVLQFLCCDIFIQKGIRVAVTQNTGYFWWHFLTFQNKIGSSHDVISTKMSLQLSLAISLVRS